MPRVPSAEREAEYDRLLRVFVALAPIAFRDGVHGESIPGRVEMLKVRESAGFSQALSGLKQGVNDLLEMMSVASPEQLRDADAGLRAAGLPGLGFLMSKRKRFIKDLLRRGAVINETEYYALREAALGASAILSEGELSLAEQMLQKFELRVVADTERGI